MAQSKAQKLINLYQEEKRIKQTWNIHYQALAENMLTRKSNFTDVFEPGDFINEDLFDTTASKAAKIASSTRLGMLWPNGARSIKLEPSDEIEDTKEHREYFEAVTEEMWKHMDDPESGLMLALDEIHLDDEVFGTSSIYIKVGKDTPISYRAWNVKNTCIQEGEDGRVNAIFHEDSLTNDQLLERYERSELSQQTQDKIKNNTIGKTRILFIVKPRPEKERRGQGNRGMPFASFHIEIENKKMIRESGFPWFPAPTTRARKTIGEKYGRSNGMDALPDTQEVHILREALIVNTEYQNRPALAVHDDGSLGGGIIDLSPGAANVFHVTGQLNGLKPVEPLFVVGDPKHLRERILELQDSIANHFDIDRLLDFNNNTQMTLGETQIRNRIRGLSLNSSLVRKEVELYTPMVEVTFEILASQGLLGVEEGSEEHQDLLEAGREDPLTVPKKIADVVNSGRVPYKIKYLTPASRLLRAETAEGILRLWDATGGMANVVAEAADRLDPDASISQLADLWGAPEDIIRDDKVVENIRKVRAETNAQNQKLALAQAQANIVKTASEAGRGQVQAV